MKKLLLFFSLLLSPLAFSALNLDEWTSVNPVYDQNGNVTELLNGETGDIIGEYAYDPCSNLTKINGVDESGLRRGLKSLVKSSFLSYVF